MIAARTPAPATRCRLWPQCECGPTATCVNRAWYDEIEDEIAEGLGGPQRGFAMRRFSWTPSPATVLATTLITSILLLGIFLALAMIALHQLRPPHG